MPNKRVLRIVAMDITGTEFKYQADPHESMATVLERFSDRIPDDIRVSDIESLTVAFDEIPAREIDVAFWRKQQQLNSNARDKLRLVPNHPVPSTQQQNAMDECLAVIASAESNPDLKIFIDTHVGWARFQAKDSFDWDDQYKAVTELVRDLDAYHKSIN